MSNFFCKFTFFALLISLPLFSFADTSDALEKCAVDHSISQLPLPTKEANLKAIDGFIKCLDQKAGMTDPRVLMIRGSFHMWAASYVKGDSIHYGLAVKDYCGAAEMDYVYGQEQCGLWLIGESPKEGYRWLKKAALNGSMEAQHEISSRTISTDVVPESERSLDNYLSQYLSCHPAMFTHVCERSVLFHKDDEEVEICRENQRDSANFFYDNVSSCQAQLRARTLTYTDEATVKKWDDIASKQLADTLLKVEHQIQRFPNLSADSRKRQ